jgi:hypothetical protein
MSHFRTFHVCRMLNYDESSQTRLVILGSACDNRLLLYIILRAETTPLSTALVCNPGNISQGSTQFSPILTSLLLYNYVPSVIDFHRKYQVTLLRYPCIEEGLASDHALLNQELGSN